jgi:hypothetical protein
MIVSQIGERYFAMIAKTLRTADPVRAIWAAGLGNAHLTSKMSRCSPYEALLLPHARQRFK